MLLPVTANSEAVTCAARARRRSFETPAQAASVATPAAATSRSQSRDGRPNGFAVATFRRGWAERPASSAALACASVAAPAQLTDKVNR